MAKLIVDSIQANAGKKLSLNDDLNVSGDVTAEKFIGDGSALTNLSLRLPTITMVFATNWQRSASDFEFTFNTFKWTNSGNPFIGNKPFSIDINPRTGNAYDFDYDAALRAIVPGSRVAWMDEDTSKWFDWNYTYVNPFTLQNQTWEPKGMIVTQTSSSNNSYIPFAAWNNTTNYVVGNKVTYNGYIWICFIANTNQTPTTTVGRPVDYWGNTGVPSTSGPRIAVPSSLKNFFEFNAMASLTDANSQWNFAGGGPGGGTVDGIHMAYGYSARLSPAIPGKMPMVTLNVFLNPTNSNRFPTPFNVQHQMDMLDYINTGMGLNPNTLPKVDLINLGSNMFNRSLCDSTLYIPYGGSGFGYGNAMINYVTQIRSNPEPITANAKIVIQGPYKYTSYSPSAPTTGWVYDSTNPLNTSVGFIHGFYNSQTGNTATTVDFDIISLQTNFSNFESSIFFNQYQNNSSVASWAYHMGVNQYEQMKNTIADCKTALTLYGKQFRIKYWYKFISRTFLISPPPGFNINYANYSWATQTGVFMAMVLAATDPDFTGFHYNNILDYNDCSINLLYNSTDTFGPNTTDVFGLTSVGWMFKRFLQYFKPELGAISFTRLLNVAGAGYGASSQYGINILDQCMGVYINSTGVNNTPKHTIILCNLSKFNSTSINSTIEINVSQLIDITWTNLLFTKIGLPPGTNSFDPIYNYVGGVQIVPQETVYQPTQADILSTLLKPTEYLMITAS